MSIKKSSKKSIKLSTAYRKLVEALETEAITGKNYRAIQKYLMALKKRGYVKIRCNAKKEILIKEAQRVILARIEHEIHDAQRVTLPSRIKPSRVPLELDKQIFAIYANAMAA